MLLHAVHASSAHQQGVSSLRNAPLPPPPPLCACNWLLHTTPPLNTSHMETTALPVPLPFTDTPARPFLPRSRTVHHQCLDHPACGTVQQARGGSKRFRNRHHTQHRNTCLQPPPPPSQVPSPCHLFFPPSLVPVQSIINVLTVRYVGLCSKLGVEANVFATTIIPNTGTHACSPPPIPGSQPLSPVLPSLLRSHTVHHLYLARLVCGSVQPAGGGSCPAAVHAKSNGPQGLSGHTRTPAGGWGVARWGAAMAG